MKTSRILTRVILLVSALVIAVTASHLSRGCYDDLLNVGWLDAYVMGIGIVCLLYAVAEVIGHTVERGR
jgi:hypothetical protein